MVSKPGAKGATPASGAAPWLGRQASTPHRAPGTRTDPPVSAPNAASASPPPAAASDLEEDLPVSAPRSRGLIEGGGCGLAPPRLKVSLSVTVLPMIRAPAARRAVTSSAPCRSIRSMTTMRSLASGPLCQRAAPRRTAQSALVGHECAEGIALRHGCIRAERGADAAGVAHES